jgi:excisionase family DNA binding protein
MSNRRRKKSTVVVPEPNPQEFQARGLPVSEAARYLGSTVCHVRSLIRNREVPVLVLGKRHILLRESLDEYLDLLKKGGVMHIKEFSESASVKDAGRTS